MIYFLHGEDSYRSRQKLNEIVGQYKKVHKSGLNLIYTDAKQNDFKDFFDNFRTTSMFGEKKLVILKNGFSNAKFQEEFLENIKSIKELKDIVVVFSAQGGSAPDGEGVDRRSKLFKALKKNAKCQEFKFLQPAMLRKWIAEEFKKNNANADFAAQDLLLNFVGKDLWQMAHEIKKLSNYKKGETIKKQDVELLVRPNIENDIFKTIDALASKNKNLALALLHKHLDGGDNPLYLLSMVAYQFRNLLIIKDLIDKKNPYEVIAQKSGLHPFVVKKNFYICRQFSMQELKKIYQRIFQVDCDVKSGRIDAELALDLLVSVI